jgi:hypothetical protein
MRILLSAFSFLFLLTAQAERTKLEIFLYDLPGVIIKKIDSPDGYSETYELMIKQPLDHSDHSSGYFYQKVFLSHRNIDAPTVIITQGYGLRGNYIYEPSELLVANQVNVEHRFFGKSMPDSIDYRFLTLENACADLHHIRELLGAYYENHWISSGISKGGQTSIMYRYFYPEDVTVSIPYVAPLNFSLEDERIYTFLDTVGSKACRDNIYAFQSRLFRNYDACVDKLKWYAKGADLEFNYLNFEEAFELAVLEYAFSFWQWGASCDDIPDGSAGIDADLDYFLEVSGIDFFADASMEGYASHYYQAALQYGYYGYRTEGFEDYMRAWPRGQNPSAIFTPNKMKVEFQSHFTKEVDDWLKREGDNFIYVIGGWDTWSATAVVPSKKVNSLWIVLPKKDHRAARMRNMSEDQLNDLIAHLESWLGIPIDNIFSAE